MELFADIIIDISHSELDRTFQYRVPEELQQQIEPGNVVEIPFGKGNRPSKGYVLRLTDQPSFDPRKIKPVTRIVTDLAGAESRLTALALWMRDYYGSTTVQALRTVLPVRQKAAPREKKTVVLTLSGEALQEKLEWFRKKNQKARLRLLEALAAEPSLPYEIVTGTLKITPSVLRAMEEQGILTCESQYVYRTPQLIRSLFEQESRSSSEQASFSQRTVTLNEEQQAVVDGICGEWETNPDGRYLIHGVTGSGKTEVYMELIACALAHGQQAILLIPEISLTYQNVMRFYRRFGDRISILHSRLSQGERYDQFERAKNGDIDIMIGPRSALFTPFSNLGIIIIDEEHEPSYRSETVPRYHARETAVRRGMLEHAKVVLGSATPSLEAYYGARQGAYRLFTMSSRAAGGTLPAVHTVDLREELRAGNRSILSRFLRERMENCLAQHHQMMLFMNRRGYAGFVVCRACGHVMKCPHCDVSLSLHRNGRLICHYCGHQEAAVQKCPKCGSGYIGGFRAGTQQVEEIVAKEFPQARILRMDADTTRGKDGHAEILRTFSKREADILIGTQMIVKGHDFPDVTLVGILAADLSLHVSDYRASERTFQLLTQAAGRAGRGKLAGEVVIQTYDPEHYAVTCAAAQDYAAFYEKEIACRFLSGYPPAGGMLGVHCTCSDRERLEMATGYLGRFARQ
ncbi:MAG: primosomal protein N', partial [Lachnospiraceae bacterium]|nr:primosomal protein N' [Lachnospiraceae bacterium]